MKTMLQSLIELKEELENIKHKNKELVKEIIQDCIDFEDDPTDNDLYYEILSKYRELDIKKEIDWSKAFRI